MGAQATPDAEGGVWRVHVRVHVCVHAERGGAVQVLTWALGLLEGVHDVWAAVKENQDHRLVLGGGARQRIHLKLSASTKMASGGMTRGALPCDDRRGRGARLPRHPALSPGPAGLAPYLPALLPGASPLELFAFGALFRGPVCGRHGRKG